MNAADHASYSHKLAARPPVNEVALAALRAECSPDKNLTAAQLRAYAEAVPGQANIAECALRGDRGSRAEIAHELGAKTYTSRTWRLSRY